jgi:hypothetical protein
VSVPCGVLEVGGACRVGGCAGSVEWWVDPVGWLVLLIQVMIHGPGVHTYGWTSPFHGPEYRFNKTDLQESSFPTPSRFGNTRDLPLL